MTATRTTSSDKGTIRVGREDVELKRLAPAPVAPAQLTRHEAQFLAAFTAAADSRLISQSPPEGMVRALSRMVAEDPKTVLARIRGGITLRSTDVADVAVMRTVVSCFGVLPGDQPRGAAKGGRPNQVADPKDESNAGEHLGLRVLRFTDLDHLRRWCADAIDRSLERAKKRARPQEIVASGVRCEISISMVLLRFEDGTPEQWVPMASDGISRLSVCLAGALGVLEKDCSEAAKTIVATLIPANGLNSDSRSNELVKRMQRQHHKHVETYSAHLVDGSPDEIGARLRQFLTLPANLHLLATDPDDATPHTLESCMQGVVSDTHTGVDGWDPEDGARHTVIRALTKLHENGQIKDDLYALATGRADASVADNLVSPQQPANPDTVLLRRAVTLQAELLGPEHYEELKKALREFGEHRQLRLAPVVAYLAPLLCEPWATLRPITKAWNYGGPVLGDLTRQGLRPVHPVDYLDLVREAMDPSSSEQEADAARLELALAGGTALLADGVLTTAVVGGSGGSKTTLAFRGTVEAAVAALTRTEKGLTLLAIAANAFRPGKLLKDARLPMVDMTREDRIDADGRGHGKWLEEEQVAQIAAEGDDEHAPEAGVDGAGGVHEQTPEELLQQLAKPLPGRAQNLLKTLEEVKDLRDRTGAPVGLAEPDCDAMHDSLAAAAKLALKLA